MAMDRPKLPLLMYSVHFVLMTSWIDGAKPWERDDATNRRSSRTCPRSLAGGASAGRDCFAALSACRVPCVTRCVRRSWKNRKRCISSS